MLQYKTPDVYLQEKILVSPSVSGALTAIPAFIGFTKLTTNHSGDAITNIPVAIGSMAEFEAVFGGGQTELFSVAHDQFRDEYALIDAEQGTKESNNKITFYLYQAVAHFFANGGGRCYLLSIGDYRTPKPHITSVLFKDAIDLLEAVDEVTLLSIPESVLMSTLEHYSVQSHALLHCEKMKNRFALLDVQQVSGFSQGKPNVDIPAMRNRVAVGLQYGAAYYPYVRTSTPRRYEKSSVMVNYSLTLNKLHSDFNGCLMSLAGEPLDQYGFKISDQSGPYPVYINIHAAKKNSAVSAIKLVDSVGFEVDTHGQRMTNQPPFGIFTDDGADITAISAHSLDHLGFETKGKASNERKLTNGSVIKYVIAAHHLKLTASLAYLSDPKGRLASSVAYSAVKSLLAKNYLVLPPSAAMAGIMAQTDAALGVWKAPANVALSNVREPCVAIDNGEQQNLNVDLVAGKSVNAIRNFVGKGTLVWGARTLMGNDREWRYISVRRLFNMVEESIKKASYFAVFETNTAFTWLKLKTMIENYLENLWRQGALCGDTADAAFFVNVGLGQTMTEDDVNNGIMNIEVGLAAVRPAEFIILTFSHTSLAG
ncbi:MAG: phage tail sheath C-terminal domain-containing protein [Cycloclasticus sp.]|jgi:Phage tail sheath protein FI